MMREDDGPDRSNIELWRERAGEFLRQHFSEPITWGRAEIFPLSPLHGEGATAIFEFQAAKPGAESERYFAAVGRTEPNYYPAYGLDMEHAYALHLGTRFMLVMGVAAMASPAKDEYDPLANAKEILTKVGLEGSVERATVAAMFDVDGEKHVVLRATLDGRSIYIMGRDAPWGFSERGDLPPQVAYRMHIGQVLRAEPDPDQNRPAAGHE